MLLLAPGLVQRFSCSGDRDLITPYDSRLYLWGLVDVKPFYVVRALPPLVIS